MVIATKEEDGVEGQEEVDLPASPAKRLDCGMLAEESSRGSMQTLVMYRYPDYSRV